MNRLERQYGGWNVYLVVYNLYFHHFGQCAIYFQFPLDCQ